MFRPHAVSIRRAFTLLAAFLAIGPSSSRTAASRLDIGHQSTHESAAYAKLPAAFVENRGQLDPRVRYYAQGPRYAFYLTRDAIVLSFVDDPGSRGVALALRFPGSNPGRTLQAEERVPGEANYFRGSDPGAWRTSIPRFAQAAYRELWSGVDLRLREQPGTLKYEFRVRAGAHPEEIRMAYDGASRLSTDASGALLIETGIGTLRDAAPVSYQIVDGARVPVASRYRMIGATEYGFTIGAGYRPDLDLVIDPAVQYSTLLGGSSHELAAGIKVDGNGNAYLVGTTQSPDFPTTAGAFKRTGAASNFGDVFVSKLNAAGTALVYSTFIGGNDFDFGRAIAIDASGNAYITGQTKSPSFPTTAGAFDRTFNVDTCPRCGIDQYDAFVAKLNASGSALVYSTFLGGFDIDDGLAIAVDGAGSAYVTGETGSLNFPTTAAAFDRTKNGAFDAFVTKVNAAGSALAYSTYLGATQVEFGSRIAVDAGGNAYVAGATSSADFPATAGALDTSFNGAFDVFVTKLNAAGSALVYSTFLGGQGFDSDGGLALDAAGNAYLSGSAGSTDFPTTPGAFDTLSDGADAFVAKLNAAGSALVYSTALGGTSAEAANAIVLDASGNAWVTGGTDSSDFPVTADAADFSFNGVADAFVSELSANGAALLYSTYLGGTNAEAGDDIARGATGVYVAGHTYSIDFPTTAGAFDIVFNGNTEIFWGDGFVTKYAFEGASTPPSTPPAPSAPTLAAPSNGDTPPQPITFQWNAASGAASYTIQIDDSSAFTAPLVREQQNVTVLRYATSNLPTTQHFWRVRGVNTAGVAGAWSAVRSFIPGEAPPPAVLTNLDINPTTVAGGEASSGTVIFSVGAPEGGAVVALSSSQPSVASVPATVTAPSNSFTGTFTIATSAVASSRVVTITASYNGTTRTGTLTVTPPASSTPLPTVQGLVLNPSSVVGGSSSQATVTLSGAAPQGGSVVSLQNGNPSAATMPGDVTVAAGTTAAAFTISTHAVSVSTSLSILASYNSTNRSAVLTVQPSSAPPPPPPPQTATLTVSATGRSGERITSSPAGISVSTGTTGSASFASGAAITLSVSGGRDAIWSGACSSNGNKRATCTFTLTSAATVTANVQ